jgi:hypothetical protein
MDRHADLIAESRASAVWVLAASTLYLAVAAWHVHLLRERASPDARRTAERAVRELLLVVAFVVLPNLLSACGMMQAMPLQFAGCVLVLWLVLPRRRAFL